MIVVTGGAGFIGSALIWALNEIGEQQIVSVDKLGMGEKWRNLVKRDVAFNLSIDEFLPWLEKNGDQVEAVFHMGACSSTTERDADFLMSNNVHYSQSLWSFCARKDIPFIYASSAATYGSKDNDFSDQHNQIDSLRPINKYGWSKQLFDRWALHQVSSPSQWFGLKFFNVYGPQEYHKGSQASVVFHAYPQIKHSGSLKLFKSYKEGIGHGEQMRDFVYVKDVVNVMIHLWQNGKQGQSGIYNLGTGQARSFADLGRAVFSALNTEEKFTWIEMPDNIKNQYQYFTEADLQKLRNEAGYDAPFHSLEAGVKDYVQNYLEEGDRFL
ncbi:ADP-glyceromanno-heptose 6-epimerase [Pseudobacteriovorax antillogorgiicola]|uniref:ADP-L-glycero-D-manno-heptose-6-epimerase n=1 Tax=Pseudobacteriovorax antillogorgiicola TaxID=1513793 RepID=A0A1Y6CNI4_9BACT|nr:ADP-glyceromanno-heptose 6-epimerase [Pseudobacteriovorax antillogorgiicola]TCS46669.1 ADP-glyceromanno-heptose 6-epimerase precursor [Pseudobacteriovorax antillogorgiicola]SMF66588.1 ADP-glyceromanno-heptose 6-epimerase precursor [Pseudobacteriovorax antillogorgiicola]